MTGMFFKFSGDGNGNGEGILHQGDGVCVAKKPNSERVVKMKEVPPLDENYILIEKKEPVVSEKSEDIKNEAKEKNENGLEKKFKELFSKEKISGVRFKTDKGDLKSPGRQIQSAFWDNGALIQLMRGFFEEKQKQLEDPQTASDEEILQFCINHLDDIKSTGNPENTKRAIRAVCEAQLNLQPTKEHGEVDENLRKELDDLWNNQILSVHDELTKANEADWNSGLYREEAKRFFNDETKKLNKLIEEINGNVTPQGDVAEYSEKSREFFNSVLEKIKTMQTEYEQNKLQYLKAAEETNSGGPMPEQRGENSEQQEALHEDIKTTKGNVVHVFSEIDRHIIAGKKEDVVGKVGVKFTLSTRDAVTGLKEEYEKIATQQESAEMLEQLKMLSHKALDILDDCEKRITQFSMSAKEKNAGRGENSLERVLDHIEKTAEGRTEKMKSGNFDRKKDRVSIDSDKLFTKGLTDTDIAVVEAKLSESNKKLHEAFAYTKKQKKGDGTKKIPPQEKKNDPLSESEDAQMKEIEALFEKAKDRITEKTQIEAAELSLEKVLDYDIRTTFDELLDAEQHHDKFSPDEQVTWDKMIGIARKISQAGSREQYVVVDGKTFKVIEGAELGDRENHQEKLPLKMIELFETYAINVSRTVEAEFFGEDKLFPEDAPDAERKAFISLCLRKKISMQIEKQKELLNQYQFDEKDGTMLIEKLLQKALTQK